MGLERRPVWLERASPFVKTAFLIPGIISLASAVWATPPAGMMLATRAAVGYRDPYTGEIKSVTSNSVTITVAQVADVTLSIGSSYVVATQGEIASAPVTVFNAGNGSDAFDLRVVGPPGWTAQLYLDSNKDGKRQTSEPVASQTALLELGKSASLVLAVSVPQQAGAAEGAVSVTASSTYDSNVSESGQAVFTFEPTNFLPELSSPSISMAQGQRIRMSVVYRDKEGEGPDAGQPVVWIDNPSEEKHPGIVSEVSDSLIVDTSAGWPPGQFRGKPVQVDVPGTPAGVVYTVIDNTETTLYVDGNPVYDGVAPGQEFRLQQIALVPESGEIVTGKTYSNVMPLTSTGHQAHFSVTSQQNYRGTWRSAYVRCPKSGELSCPAIGESSEGNISPMLKGGAITPAVCRQGEMVTMTVTYSDTNGDAPANSGTKRGYIWAVVDGYPHPMQVNGSSFAQGVACSFAIAATDLGVHSVYFVASDGQYRVQYPEVGTLTFRVNSRPSLSQPSLTPTSGSEARSFTFSVIYSDPDGLPPESVSVLINGKAVALAPDASGSANYMTGVRFRTTLIGREIGIGAHNHQFVAFDGLEWASPVPASPAPGPVVGSNTAPVLSGGSVNPASGTDYTVFRFAVTYSDADGDPPAYVRAIVGDLPPIQMAARSGQPGTYRDGLAYTADALLPPGHYRFRFEASDSLAVAQDPPGGGTRDGIDVVARQNARISLDGSGQYVIGQSPVVKGTIEPPSSVRIYASYKRPDGTSSGSWITSTSDGKFNFSFTPDMTGPCKASAWFAGSELYGSAYAEVGIAVGGPALITGGLQMVGLPYIPLDSSPVGTFGAKPPFMIARWLPDESRYAVFDTTGRFESDSEFPPIAPGCGYWFGTFQNKLVLPVGRLVDQDAEFPIQLTAGWNQIGFVYLQPSAWAGVKVRVGGREYTLLDACEARIMHSFAWTYDGVARCYKMVHPSLRHVARDLEPWRGYWVYAFEDCEVVLQPPDLPSASEVLAQSVQWAAKDEWQIRLAARLVVPAAADRERADFQDSDNFLGLSLEGSKANLQSPAYRADYVDLYFTKPFGADQPGRYASDFRPSVRRGDTWEFVVESDAQEGECAVSWTEMESVPAGLSLVLEDLETQQKVNMRAASEYRYQHRKGEDRRFRVVASG